MLGSFSTQVTWSTPSGEGISAIVAFWVRPEGSVLDLAAANVFTALGGLCFLVGALLLVAESGSAGTEAGSEAAGSPG